MNRIIPGVAALGAVIAVGGISAARAYRHDRTPPKQVVLYWVDPMHPAYKTDHPGIAPDCGMQLAPVYADQVRVSVSQLAKPQADHPVHVPTVVAKQVSGTEVIHLTGRVVPDQTRIYKVNVGVDGFVRETYNDAVGNFVKKHQRLAAIYSLDLLNTAGGFLSATERPQNTSILPGAAAVKGATALQNWADRLRVMGMDDSQIEEIRKSQLLPNSIYITSPVDGFILARNITAGQKFERHTELYQVADLSRVWIVADIPPGDERQIHPGAVGHVTPLGENESIRASVTDSLPQFDVSTQTLKVRLHAVNSGFVLRPNMYVDVEFTSHGSPLTSVPASAVLDSGLSKRVFVEKQDGSFEARQVGTGRRVGDRIFILGGLRAGERVASSAAFLLDSETRLQKHITLSTQY